MRLDNTRKTIRRPLLPPLLICLLSLPSPSFAEWTVSGERTSYNTDDAALFSATRRLSPNQDPIQPVINGKHAKQGNDVVSDPVAQIAKSFSLIGCQTELGVLGQGFVFTSNTQFSRGSFGVQASHNLTPSISLIFRYFLEADHFLVKNEVRPVEKSGGGQRGFKKQTSHHEFLWRRNGSAEYRCG